jgi:transcriptional regulator GlxA family with amidase domain
MKPKAHENKEFNSRRTFLTNAAAAASSFALSPVLSWAQSPMLPPPTVRDGRLTLGMVVFDGFQLLDVFGPLDVFGSLRDKISIVIIGEKGETVKSGAGPVLKLDFTFANAPKVDILMIPGGMGTRREVNNEAFLNAFKALATTATKVATICTGSAVLAKTGLLDGHKATTNKRAYAWATSQSDKVTWIPEARWVEDGKFFSSSGVSAGIDMALGLIAHLYGRDTAIRIANGAEYEWHEDSHWDPFAKMNGLVN